MLSKKKGIKANTTNERNANERLKVTVIVLSLFQEIFNNSNLFCRRQTQGRRQLRRYYRMLPLILYAFYELGLS